MPQALFGIAVCIAVCAFFVTFSWVLIILLAVAICMLAGAGVAYFLLERKRERERLQERWDLEWARQAAKEAREEEFQILLLRRELERQPRGSAAPTFELQAKRVPRIRKG